MGRAVEVQRDAEALVAGTVAPPQHGRIVTADLSAPRAIGCRAVELVENERLHGVRAVVHARRQHVDAEGVLFGRAQAQLRARAVDLRSDVHGGPRLVGRDVPRVQRHGGLDSVEEQAGRHRRAGYELGRVLQPQSIAVGSEHLDLVGRRAEGLQPLVGLLAVVEGRGHAMDADIGVGHELERGPLARRFGVVGLDMSIDYS